MNTGLARALVSMLFGLLLFIPSEMVSAQAWIELQGPPQTSYNAPATYQLQISSGVRGTGPKAEYLSDIKLTRNGAVISRIASGTYGENGISAGNYEYVLTALAIRNVNGDEIVRQLRSAVVNIAVAAPPTPFDGAEYVSASWPNSGDRGTPFSGTVTFRNTGNTTWTAGESFRLGQAERYVSSATALGIGDVVVPHDVGPGGTATFAFNGTAPNENGPYTVQWQMNHNGVRFGSTSSEQTFTATGKLNRGVAYEQEVPETMVAGRPYTVRLKFTNTGNTTWSSNNGYFLGSWNPDNNMRWGVARVRLPNDVIPQLPGIFEFTVIAPSLPGTYSFQWRMVEEGVEWFGGASPEKLITVSGPPSDVIGNIDNVTASGQINGWACSTRIDSPIDIHVYTGAEAGSSGTFLTSGRADQASEAEISAACQAAGSHRFSIQLTSEERAQRAGQKIYVHGISPVGRPNNAISGSGSFVVPPAPAGTLSATPASCQIASGGQSCSIRLTWTANDPLAQVRNTDGAAIGSGVGGSADVSIAAGTAQFSLAVGGQVLASVTVTAKAPPTSPGNPDHPGPTITRKYVYDSNLRLCKTIEPETGATVIEYDAAGNVAWSAQGLDLPDALSCDRDSAAASSRKITHSYDSLNRPVAVNYPDSLGNQQIQYTTDGNVRSEVALNQDGVPVVSDFTYNSLGLVTSQSRSVGTESPRTVAFSYDAAGRPTGTTYPDGFVVQQTLNALGQPVSIHDGNGALLAGSISYAPDGTLAGMVYGNGVVRSVQQNGRQLISQVKDGAVMDFTYGYDPAGNVASVQDAIRGDAGRISMSYDRLNRLVQANAPAYGGSGQYKFAYDTLDNIIDMRLPGKRERSFHYDGKNRLELLRDEQESGVSGFAYDAAGNLVTRNGQSLIFDVSGRLRSAGSVQKYFYDATGYRAGAEGDASNRWQYMPDGDLLESIHDGEVTNYIYLDTSLIALRKASPGGAQLTYLHRDLMKNVVASTDSNGSVISRHFWSPYGEPDVATDASIPGYSGHITDSETGLVYMGQRYYDPQLGRFISSDPDEVDGGDGANFNRYRYASGNPIRFHDPDGRQTVVIGPGGVPMPVPVPLPTPTPSPIMTEDGPVDSQPQTVDLVGVVVRAVRQNQQQKTYITYTMTKSDGIHTVTYVGRSSGEGTPESIMMRRYQGHWIRRLEGYGKPTLDKSATGTQGKLAIRGREQQMIDYKGGIGDPRVGNLIRGVSKPNPSGLLYHESSNAMFGEKNSFTGNQMIRFGN